MKKQKRNLANKLLSLFVVVAFITTTSADALLLSKRMARISSPNHLSARSAFIDPTGTRQTQIPLSLATPGMKLNQKPTRPLITSFAPLLLVPFASTASLILGRAKVAQHLRKNAEDLREIAFSLRNPSAPINTKTILGKIMISSIFIAFFLNKKSNSSFFMFISTFLASAFESMAQALEHQVEILDAKVSASKENRAPPIRDRRTLKRKIRNSLAGLILGLTLLAPGCHTTWGKWQQRNWDNFARSNFVWNGDRQFIAYTPLNSGEDGTYMGEASSALGMWRALIWYIPPGVIKGKKFSPKFDNTPDRIIDGVLYPAYVVISGAAWAFSFLFEFFNQIEIGVRGLFGAPPAPHNPWSIKDSNNEELTKSDTPSPSGFTLDKKSDLSEQIKRLDSLLQKEAKKSLQQRKISSEQVQNLTAIALEKLSETKRPKLRKKLISFLGTLIPLQHSKDRSNHIVLKLLLRLDDIYQETANEEGEILNADFEKEEPEESKRIATTLQENYLSQESTTNNPIIRPLVEKVLHQLLLSPKSSIQIKALAASLLAQRSDFLVIENTQDFLSALNGAHPKYNILIGQLDQKTALSSIQILKFVLKIESKRKLDLPHLTALSRFLKHEDPQVRRAALEAIGELSQHLGLAIMLLKARAYHQRMTNLLVKNKLGADHFLLHLASQGSKFHEALLNISKSLDPKTQLITLQFLYLNLPEKKRDPMRVKVLQEIKNALSAEHFPEQLEVILTNRPFVFQLIKHNEHQPIFLKAQQLAQSIQDPKMRTALLKQLSIDQFFLAAFEVEKVAEKHHMPKKLFHITRNTSLSWLEINELFSEPLFQKGSFDSLIYFALERAKAKKTESARKHLLAAKELIDKFTEDKEKQEAIITLVHAALKTGNFSLAESVALQLELNESLDTLQLIFDIAAYHKSNGDIPAYNRWLQMGKDKSLALSSWKKTKRNKPWKVPLIYLTDGHLLLIDPLIELGELEAAESLLQEIAKKIETNSYRGKPIEKFRLFEFDVSFQLNPYIIKLAVAYSKRGDSKKAKEAIDNYSHVSIAKKNSLYLILAKYIAQVGKFVEALQIAEQIENPLLAFNTDKNVLPKRMDAYLAILQNVIMSNRPMNKKLTLQILSKATELQEQLDSSEDRSYRYKIRKANLAIFKAVIHFKLGNKSKATFLFAQAKGFVKAYSFAIDEIPDSYIKALIQTGQLREALAIASKMEYLRRERLGFSEASNLRKNRLLVAKAYAKNGKSQKAMKIVEEYFKNYDQPDMLNSLSLEALENRQWDLAFHFLAQAFKKATDSTTDHSNNLHSLYEKLNSTQALLVNQFFSDYKSKEKHSKLSQFEELLNKNKYAEAKALLSQFKEPMILQWMLIQALIKDSHFDEAMALAKKLDSPWLEYEAFLEIVIQRARNANIVNSKKFKESDGAPEVEALKTLSSTIDELKLFKRLINWHGSRYIRLSDPNYLIGRITNKENQVFGNLGERVQWLGVRGSLLLDLFELKQTSKEELLFLLNDLEKIKPTPDETHDHFLEPLEAVKIRARKMLDNPNSFQDKTKKNEPQKNTPTKKIQTSPSSDTPKEDDVWEFKPSKRTSSTLNKDQEKKTFPLRNSQLNSIESLEIAATSSRRAQHWLTVLASRATELSLLLVFLPLGWLSGFWFRESLFEKGTQAWEGQSDPEHPFQKIPKQQAHQGIPAVKANHIKNRVNSIPMPSISHPHAFDSAL